jgi:hypothetical protein
MNHRFVVSLVMCGAAVSGGCERAAPDEGTRDPAPLVVPGPLTAAHEAYLDGDFVALGERVRDALLDPAASDTVQQNAFELLDKAYEAQNGKLPSNFKLPPGYRSMQYVIFHNATAQGPSYEIHLRVLTRDASHLTGLTLRRLPDEVLLDKATGKGQFLIRRDPSAQKAGVEEVVLDSGPVAAPPADGVMSVRLELDDGTAAEGFFIAHALASSATPEVQSPSPFASIADANPRVTWAPFRSPECTSFERRGMGIQVKREGEGTLAWEFYTKAPDETTEVRLGSPAGLGRSELSPGNYRLLVVAAETRSFGPIDLLRGSRTIQGFHVTR